MGLLEKNTAFYTTTMKRANTLDKYYRVLKTQVNIIEAHSGNPGYRVALVLEHLDAYMVKKGYKRPEK